MSIINSCDYMTYKDNAQAGRNFSCPFTQSMNGHKNEVYDKFKPYVLKIKELNNLPCCVSCKNSINIAAKVGDVVKIIIDDDVTKEILLKIFMEKSENFNDNCLLTDKDGNNFVGSSIRCYINYVPNNLTINGNSIMSNITDGKENLTIEEVYEICKLVGLYDSIIALPQGFDTKIDNKTNITNAAKYKIVIARELIIDNPIIIFDEPDLFLNNESGTILNSIIKFLIKNHIILVITKLNNKLNLNEKIIELCSYDKVRINKDIIYNLQ